MYQGPDTGNRKIKIPKEALLKPGQARQLCSLTVNLC